LKQFFDDLPKNESYYGYSVRVEGLSGIIFKEEASLGYNSAQTSVMIQTDKGIYKPGEKVRFRVIFTNSDTRAVINAPATIYIADNKNNRVKEWKTLNLEKTYGVFSNELKLSRQPVLGNWNIFVQYDDNEVSSLRIIFFILF
jgi:CD109 antigen